MSNILSRRTALGLGLASLALARTPARAEEAAADQQSLVDRAARVIEDLKHDPNFSDFDKVLGRAKAVLVIPQQVRAGFIIGGEGGSGVLLARGNGNWSYPAFYTLGSGSLGLQIGVEVSEVVLTIMNDRALDKLLSDKVSLGADVSVAAGPVGGSLAAATTMAAGADIYAFAHSKGLFGGAAIKGGVLVPSEEANKAYYGRAATAHEIVIDRKVSNARADKLRAVLPTG